nr:DUF3471 domain-containing protein [Shouchella rhizosphaerae]
MAGEEYDVPRPLETKKVIPLDPKNVETLLGKYRFASETEGSLDVDVYMEQDKLYMKLDNGMRLSLLPLTSTRYYEEQTATELEFLDSEDGKGMRLFWYTEDEPEVAERVGC